MVRFPVAVFVLATVMLVRAAPGAYAAGMPQLDFANPLTTWQVIWGGVIFALLYILLSRSALPRVASVLADRQARIDGDLEAAREAKSASDRAIDDLRRARRQAAGEAQANLDRVIAEARAAATTRARVTAARLDAELAAAEAQISAERERALTSLRGIAIDTAHLLVERVTGHSVDISLVGHRVDEALSGTAPTSIAYGAA